MFLNFLICVNIVEDFANSVIMVHIIRWWEGDANFLGHSFELWKVLGKFSLQFPPFPKNLSHLNSLFYKCDLSLVLQYLDDKGINLASLRAPENSLAAGRTNRSHF